MKLVNREYLSMAQIEYPYLDLTVLPELRKHVIAPNASVLFDTAIENILWINGEGSALLGAPSVRHALAGEVKLNAVMKRQIISAVEQLDDEDDASAVMRGRRGFKTALIGFNVKPFTMPNGENAILLVTESLHGRGHSYKDMAQSAVDCLDGFSHASAVIDSSGDVVAGSQHFSKLEVEQSELQNLVKEVSTETDRLVKRPIRTKSGMMPAGIARLSDEPTSQLLIIADADGDTNVSVDTSSPTQKITTVADSDAPSTSTETHPDSESDDTPKVGAFSNRRSANAAQKLGRWYFKPQKTEEDSPQEEISDTSEVEGSDKELTSEEASSEIPSNADVPSSIVGSGLVQEVEHSDLSNANDDQVQAEATKMVEAISESPSDEKSGPSIEPAAKAVRFVWEMDADHRFSSVSEEFASAVGPRSSDIVGKTWEEVAAEWKIDNGAEIADLLNKEDTWSGKTVLWPVDDADLRVPIDLAGLPSYGRSDGFVGFNGFGIVRTADAVVDDQLGDTKDRSASPADKVDAASTTVVDLDDRRDQKNQRSLSSDEEETFQEIGEKLNNSTETDQTQKSVETEDHSTKKDVLPSAFARKPKKTESVSPEIATDIEKSSSVGESSSSNVDTSILSRLPIPVLVYRDDELLFGNQEFFSVTGHDSLDTLSKAGGIETLFGGEDENASATHVFHANGNRLDYSANLQSVPWDDERAMLLTLRKGESNGDDNDPDSQSGKLKSDHPEDKHSHPSDTSTVEGQDDGSKTNLSSVVPFTRANPDAESSKAQNIQQAFGGLEADDLRSILDTATDGVIILSDEGIVRAINRSAEALFDVSPDEVVDYSFTKMLAPESHRLAMDYLSGISGPGVSSLMNDGREIIGKTTKGGLIPLFITIGKLEKTDACCVVVRDITEWKKAEEELLSAKSVAENASAQKTEFLAKISHEIRTPLNAIIGFSDLMIEERFGKIDNDRYRGYLRDIHRSGNHVLELINDLLDISKIEAGKMDLEFDACDLNTTVSETVALTQPDANKERVIIRTSLSAVVPKVVADPRSLRQIILNLVSNSIKYTKPGGQVIVSTVYEESGEVALRIRDTGIGMSQLELAQALKPFQQINSESETQGTGLGLPLTKAMVEANRAQFHIESEPDEGTLVEIFFPTQRVLADR